MSGSSRRFALYTFLSFAATSALSIVSFYLTLAVESYPGYTVVELNPIARYLMATFGDVFGVQFLWFAAAFVGIFLFFRNGRQKTGTWLLLFIPLVIGLDTVHDSLLFIGIHLSPAMNMYFAPAMLIVAFFVSTACVFPRFQDLLDAL